MTSGGTTFQVPPLAHSRARQMFVELTMGSMSELTGVQLRLARDADGRLVGISVLGLNPEPFTRPLTCPDPQCAAPVVPVREHARADESGALTVVTAHFRLAPSAHHVQGCLYDSAQALAAIAAGSGGNARISSGHLRLLVPTTFAHTDQNGRPQLVRPRRRAPRARTSTSPHPDRIASSAAAIQRFLDRYPADDSAFDLFQIDYNGVRLHWREFSLGTTTAELQHLALRISSAQGPAHPIAIHGLVTGIGSAKTGTSVYAEQDLRAQIELPEGRFWLYVRMRSRDPDQIASLKPGRRFLALGRWELFRPEGARSLELVLWIRRPWQIASWSDDAAR
jgi:hypothetical protein